MSAVCTTRWGVSLCQTTEVPLVLRRAGLQAHFPGLVFPNFVEIGEGVRVELVSGHEPDGGQRRSCRGSGLQPRHLSGMVRHLRHTPHRRTKPHGSRSERRAAGRRGESGLCPEILERRWTLEAVVDRAVPGEEYSAGSAYSEVVRFSAGKKARIHFGTRVECRAQLKRPDQRGAARYYIQARNWFSVLLVRNALPRSPDPLTFIVGPA
jgi:hypothetical protein